jgi:hypothetical protein
MPTIRPKIAHRRDTATSRSRDGSRFRLLLRDRSGLLILALWLLDFQALCLDLGLLLGLNFGRWSRRRVGRKSLLESRFWLGLVYGLGDGRCVVIGRCGLRLCWLGRSRSSFDLRSRGSRSRGDGRRRRADGFGFEIDQFGLGGFTGKEVGCRESRFSRVGRWEDTDLSAAIYLETCIAHSDWKLSALRGTI